MRGLDPKLCDPSFSPWDWVAVRRARELGMGATPATFHARFSDDAAFAVSASDREFLARETALAPKFG